MKALLYPARTIAQLALASLVLLSASIFAQVPVDNDGNVIGQYESAANVMPVGNEDIPRLSPTELQELVGPIALYPDDLLAIVLPASAYPLQIVAAARFLEALKTDPSLQPKSEWDDAVVALTNYPEVVELLNDDIDWTWRLGEAVVAQQADVIAAVESFRDRAYAAGNLKSDSYQTVARNAGVIEISPVADDVIYVPYYEPARVVVYQPRPVYYYYPRPYPVYYYPYSAGHHFRHSYFWGVTTAFSIGWHSDSLHVYHHSYYGHPYYGHSYWDNWWYRRPSIHVHNTTYVHNTIVNVNRFSRGDRWRPRDNRHEHVVREGYARSDDRPTRRRTAVNRQYEPITFRERTARPSLQVRNNVRRNLVATTRHEPVAQIRDTRRHEPVPQIRDTRRHEPAPRTTRQIQVRREHTVHERETRRTDSGRTEHRRSEQPSRERASRSSERAERSARPERREKDSRSQLRERRR